MSHTYGSFPISIKVYTRCQIQNSKFKAKIAPANIPILTFIIFMLIKVLPHKFHSRISILTLAHAKRIYIYCEMREEKNDFLY